MTDLAGLIERLDELQRGQDAIRGALQQAESERERAREERDRFKALYLEMLERNRKLERGLMGQQRERATSESQLTLDVLSAMLGERAAADLSLIHISRGRHGRRWAALACPYGGARAPERVTEKCAVCTRARSCLR